MHTCSHTCCRHRHLRECHHPEYITTVTLRCESHSCHIDVVLSVGVQPVQDHMPLAVPVTDLVLAGSSSRLVVHLQWGGRQGGEEGVVSSWSPHQPFLQYAL